MQMKFSSEFNSYKANLRQGHTRDILRSIYFLLQNIVTRFICEIYRLVITAIFKLDTTINVKPLVGRQDLC